LSDVGLDLEHGQRKQRRSRAIGCVALLVAFAVLIGGLYWGATAGIDAVRDRFSGPEDYEGPGSGRVLIEVQEGDTAADIAETLAGEDVVASREAFTGAASENPDSVGIQVGYYELQRQMSAEGALEVLLEPDNLIQSAVTVPEGYTVDQIVATLAENTDFTAREYRRVLRQPQRIGLPGYAEGNPEGYLFPATYMVPPRATPESILTMMVDRFKAAAQDADLVRRAADLGRSPAELVTVASLVESEASRRQDRPRVARVIYNRLEGEETDGLLQLDATVNYAAGRNLGARTTAADRQIDSPYNTYLNPGLPPGPIEAPGDAALQAAANPADGDWFYYVTVNLRTGETKFAETYAEHQRNVAELNEYCRTSEAC
jgi:UPF0755 protein